MILAHHIGRHHQRWRAGALPWIGALLLTLALAPRATAQGVPADTISGRVIASDSIPIASARVSVTGEDGRAHLAQTDSAGRYLITAPGGGGRYLVSAAAFGYVPFSAEVTRAGGSRRIERNLRLSARVITLDTLRVNTARVRVSTNKKTPAEQSDIWTTEISEGLPIERGDLAGIAALVPGAVAVSGSELSIAGQSPSQNHTTVDGATYGGASLPAEGVRSSGIVTNSYDVSRGQFSGGQIAARTISGTNLWGGALSAWLDDPTFQYGALPGDGLGQRRRRLRFSGGGGGALLRDRLFVYSAADLSRTTGPQAFFDPADPAALRRAGLAADSAQRFVQVAERLGLFSGNLGSPGDALSDFASALARVDYTLSEHHSLTARLNWRGSRFDGLGASPFRLAAGGDEQRSTDAGVLGQLASGWGSWANELRVYRSAGEGRVARALTLPAGNVQVNSLLADGTAGASTLGFGGLAFRFPEGRHTLWEAADELVRESADGAHRFQAGMLLQEESAAAPEAQNRSGTFTFNSLADLEQGRPARFTRTLTGAESETTRRYGAVYAGDAWRASEALRVIGGLRLEGSRYAGRPALSPALDSLGGTHLRGVPSDLLLSPRIGFDYTRPGSSLGVTGGIGVFGGTVASRSLAAVWNETGTGEFNRQLVCVGPAAPVPDWRAYAADPAAIPSTCADGSPAFADRSPAATLFAPGFAAPRPWRASLGAGGNLSKLITWNADGLVVHGTKLPTALDRNLASAPAFDLPEEGGRPVYAAPGEIDPGSGGVAPDASRRLPSLGTVREVGARGESWTEQLSVGVNGILGTRPQTLVALMYAFTRSRERAGGIPALGASGSTAGDPAALEWAAGDFEQRHSFIGFLSRRFGQYVSVSAIGQLASGLPFTPLVAGDVNGDGYDNDQAFVFGPQAADSALRGGMAQLLESAPGPARDCLRRQLGRIAGRNSCRTPWTPSLDVRAQIRTKGNVNSRRLSFWLTASNVTAGLDYLLHGADGLRGWGQYPLADATLLRVRGFDPDAHAFRYDVNPRFGQPLGGGLFRIPFRLTFEARITVGADPIYQPMMQAINAGMGMSGGTAKVRAQLAERIRNVPAVILGLNAAEPGTLALTPAQARRLRTAADSLAPKIETALDSLTAAFTERGPATAARGARIQERAQAAQALVEAGLRAARETLTTEQQAKLPHWLTEPPDIQKLQEPPTFEVQMSIPEGAG